MDKAIIAIILLIFLVGCAQPPSTIDSDSSNNQTEEPQQAEPDQAETTEPEDRPVVNETVEVEEEEEDDSPIDPTANDRIDVETIGESSKISGTVLDVPYDFTLPYTDKDAIIFEVSKKIKRPLDYVRYIIHFDGNPYLKPSEKQDFEEEVEETIEPTEYDYINMSVTKDDGFIREIGCDFENRIIKMSLTNPTNETVKLYKPVSPRIKNALVIYLNGKLLEKMKCDADEIEANETISCVKSKVYFVKGDSSNLISDAGYDSSLVDKLVASRPGYNEQITFECMEV